jgi:hypothetical protein
VGQELDECLPVHGALTVETSTQETGDQESLHGLVRRARADLKIAGHVGIGVRSGFQQVQGNGYVYRMQGVL